MNFKALAIVALCLSLSGCGVKSDPVPPPGKELPSYVDKFLKHSKLQESDKDKPQNKDKRP